MSLNLVNFILLLYLNLKPNIQGLMQNLEQKLCFFVNKECFLHSRDD